MWVHWNLIHTTLQRKMSLSLASILEILRVCIEIEIKITL